MSTTVDWEPLNFSETIILRQPALRLKINDCTCRLDFLIPKSRSITKDILASRDELLFGNDCLATKRAISSWPPQQSGNDRLYAGVLSVAPLASGGFGFVEKGLDLRTGDLVAIKKMRCTEGKWRHRKALVQELQISREVKVPANLLYTSKPRNNCTETFTGHSLPAPHAR